MNKKRISLSKEKKTINVSQQKISHFLTKEPSDVSKNQIELSQQNHDSLLENNLNKKRKSKIEAEFNQDSIPNCKLRKTLHNTLKHNVNEIIDLTGGNKNLQTKISSSTVDEVIDIDTLFEGVDFSLDDTWSISPKKKNIQKTEHKTKQNTSNTINFKQEKMVLKESHNIHKVLQETQQCKTKNNLPNNSSENDNLKEQSFQVLEEFDKKEKDKTENDCKLKTNMEKNLEESYCHEVDDMNELFDDDWCDSGVSIDIDLSNYKRCKVVDIEHFLYETLLTVNDPDSNAVTFVRCREFWRQVRFEKNQMAIIKAKRELNQWIIDNNYGFFISEPDTLLSGTTVVGGLFCQRRSVIKDIFQGLETLPHYEPDALVLITGILSHEIMQEALEYKIYTNDGITKLYEKKLCSQRVVNMLYINNISVKDCRAHSEPYINHIFNFIEYYIKGNNILPTDKKLKCRVEEVHDIEENIWLPKLGLKGKIDLTVKVNIHSKRKIIPIEIKTGRTTFSPEHKGQIILYAMMMKLTGRDVDSGLLLYLKENVMKEITGSHNELRDLILLRNNLAYYLTRKLKQNVKVDENKESQYSIELPEPINHPACGRCPYKTLCCAFLSKNEYVMLSEKHPLKAISDNVLKNLTTVHINYVVKWATLLQLEEAANNTNFSISDVWNVKPEKRERKGTCISNMRVIGKIAKESDTYCHTFARRNESLKDEKLKAANFHLMDFNEQEYVIVSTNERVNISAGNIAQIETDTITIYLNRNIVALYPYATFHIDKYNSNNLVGLNNYGNIGGLLDDDDNCARLRSIIIDRKPATFISHVPESTISKGAQIMKHLNDCQKQAIIKVFAANEFVLIKGMPGTGKTQTLVILIDLLVKMGSSVLIAAHTNTAVDNILLKLMDRNIDFLRLGSDARIHPALRHKGEKFLTTNCTTPESLHVVYCSKKVVGVTCYGASHPICGKRKFDICIVDESTQVLQPTILRPLYSAAKFVLVGDPKQLPPIAKSNVARKLGLNVSLFERLDNNNNSVILRAQYRMNSRIMDVANKLTYENKLITGNETIANATIQLSDYSILESSESWVKGALSPKLENSAIMLNTKSTYILNHESKSKNEIMNCNLWESAIIFKLINILLKSGMSAENIGVIAPYKVQVNCLREIIHNDIEINTVDQYQGRDKEVILYSCTKSTNLSFTIQEFDILQDHQRLTVAVTRAKHKLILIGDKHCLDRYTPFKKLFTSMNDENIITLTDGEQDFSWKDLMKSVQL